MPWKKWIKPFFCWLIVSGLLYVLIEALVRTYSGPRIPAPGVCQPDNEGQWSIGIFKGSSPFDLKPVEQWEPRADTQTAWPVANPIMTCAHVTDVPSSFVADPFLYRKDDRNWYLFYETKSLYNMQGDLGVAVSHDGGLTWKHEGVILDEPWHLSYPFVFEHDGKMYLVPEGSKSGTLRLYTTSKEDFPKRWTLDKVLIDEPLIDASLVPPQQGVDGLDGSRWYMFASNRNVKTSKNCRELEIWWSPSLHGPWSPHPLNPVRSGSQGSRMAGRPFVHGGKLYRLGQDCDVTYGHKVRTFHVTSLDSGQYHETEIHPDWDPTGGRKGDATWNSKRHHHMDAQPLQDGTWIAVMDGDRYVSDHMTWKWLGRLVWAVPTAAVLGLITVWLAAQQWPQHCSVRGVSDTSAMLSANSSSVKGSPGVSRMWPGAWFRSDMVPLLPRTQQAGGVGNDGGVDGVKLQPVKLGGGLTSPKGRRIGGGSGSSMWSAIDTTLRRPVFVCGPSNRLSSLTGWQLCGLIIGLSLGAWCCCWAAWVWGRWQVLRAIMWYVGGSGEAVRPYALLPDLTVSKFTMMVMSYEARLLTLQAFVRHYGHCSSIAEIVVVWNKGNPPVPHLDFPCAGVPVRVRAEAANSMNNRFQLDPHIKTRGVLLLDDDILMPCEDIERGFARWRQHPDRITGYYPRILEGNPPQYQCTKCEAHTYATGKFNIILAGAAFMDHQAVFQLYSGPENAEGRAYVDRVFNCDDLLLNYLWAHHQGGRQYIDWVRPTKRFDVGKLTSKRLSTGNFGPVRHNCTRDFAAMFDNPLKDVRYPLDFSGLGKPTCPNGIGCIFV